MGPEPSFVIAGTGRSGSGFISKVLRAAGVNCGHEEWWTPLGPSGVEGLDGDSSWLAVPDLGTFGGPILHQVRHPLDVIRSLVGIRMFSGGEHREFRWFMYAHQPGLVGDDVHDAMLWYAAWNERCEEHAGFRYRVEDVDAESLVTIAKFAGHDITADAAEKALEEVPANFNSRRRAELGWSDLPDGALKERVLDAAERYAYELTS